MFPPPRTPPNRASRAGVRGSKIASGIFFRTAETRVGKLRRKLRKARLVARPAATKSVSGVRYYGLRYYNPSMGRWLSRDPIGENGGRNLYGFVSNSPLVYYDARGLALTQYTRDFTQDPWLVEDLGRIFRNESRRGSGAVTQNDWADHLIVATQSGKHVKIEGELEIRFIVDVRSSPSNTGVDGLSIREHEFFHGYIAKTFWNANASLVNKWEGDYCSEGCAIMAADIANQAHLYNFYLEESVNHKFDVDQYGSNENASSSVRERNDGAYERFRELAFVAKQRLDEKIDRFNSSKCSAPSK